MKKLAYFLAAFLITMLLCTGSAFAASDADDGSIFSSLNEIQAEGSYLEYRDNYYLDMEETSMLSSPGAVIFNLLANGIFGFAKNLGCLSAVAARFALNTDIYDMVSEFLEPFFKSMQRVVFDPLAVYFIAIAVFFLLLQLLKNRHSQVIGGLIALVVVIALALFFYAKPMLILSTINDVTTELSSTIMDAPYEALTDEDDDSASATDKSVVLIFDVMVHSQWQYLEFGSIRKASSHESNILPLAVDSDERQSYIEDLTSKALTKGNTAAQIERFGLSLIFLLFDLALFIIIIGFSILIMGYQFFVVFLAILGTLVFVLALIPRYGYGLLKRWGSKLLIAGSINVLLVFFLSVIFIIMDFLYSSTESYGILPVLFMILAMGLILVTKRTEIAELFLGPGLPQFSRYADRFSDSYDHSRQTQEKQHNLRHSSYVPPEENLSEDDLREYHKQKYRTAKETADSASPTSSNDTHSTSIQTGRDYHGEYITNEDYKKAEEILEQNYALSKRKSEDDAEAQGTPVAYTDFVKRTDAIREQGGHANFDDRDLLKTVHILRRTEAAGGSMDDLIGDPKQRNSGETVDRLVMRSAVDYVDAKNSASDAKCQDTTDPPSSLFPRGLQYFRETYGEEKGEKYYEKMVQKYGEDAVQQFSDQRELTFSELNEKLRDSSTTEFLHSGVQPESKERSFDVTASKSHTKTSNSPPSAAKEAILLHVLQGKDSSSSDNGTVSNSKKPQFQHDEPMRVENWTDSLDSTSKHEPHPHLHVGTQAKEMPQEKFLEPVRTTDRQSEKTAFHSAAEFITEHKEKTRRPELEIATSTVPKGLQYFQNTFGEEKGEKYYEKMVRKHGEEKVSKFTADTQLTFFEVKSKLRNNQGGDH